MQVMQARMQKGMLDLTHLVEKLKPDEADPDAEVTLMRIVGALATAPLMEQLGDACDDEVLKRLETALVEADAFPENAFAACEKPTERRNCILLFWHMHKANMKELAESVPEEVDRLRGGANQLATGLLIKAQMLLPQNRWVQPTLAVARASALISTALWSHTDGKALEAMGKILEEDKLTSPKLELEATAAPRGTGDDCIAGQHVIVKVNLTRVHAGEYIGDSPPPPNNPQGIFEAYWLYIEGLKPQGTPNSLIAAQPMAVKDLSQKVVSAEVPFQAPGVAGEYNLRVHIVSTSVIGVDLRTDVPFTVVEDDVPALL
jgi:hypothetical protein